MDQSQSIIQKGAFTGIVTAHEVSTQTGDVFLCIGISKSGQTTVARSWEAFFPPGTARIVRDNDDLLRLTIDESAASGRSIYG